MHGHIRWFAAGLWVTACGPLPPAGDSAGASAGSSTTTGDPSSATQTTGAPPTTGETSETSGTSNTSGPQPQCTKDSDCTGFCEYCWDGECYDAVGCCYVAPNADGVDELRCQGYECYGDDDCDDGDVCRDPPGWCAPAPAIPVCDRQPLALSSIPLQGAPSAVALADLDGDGALDIVAAVPDTGTVEVALGDGLGGFQASAAFPTGLAPGDHRLAVADFNLDGAPDVAVTLAAPVGELSLLFGQDAVLDAPVLTTHASEPQQLWAGDFDGDGDPDVLTRNAAPDSPVTLRLGDGAGGFGDESGLADLAGQPFSAAVGSVVDDPARLDLVATLPDKPGASLFQYEPGTGLMLRSSVISQGQSPHSGVAVGDVDGDGVSDIVAMRTPGNQTLAQWWLLDVPQEELVIEGALTLGPVIDVDGDSFGDLVATSQLAMTVAVVFVRGRGDPCVQSHALPAAPAPDLVVAGDVDGDGKADILTGSVGQPSLTLLRSGP